MENIVRLAEYRQRRNAAQRPAPVGDVGPRYCCTRCDGDEFRLAAGGTVHCAHCGVMMRNLLVNPA